MFTTAAVFARQSTLKHSYSTSFTTAGCGGIYSCRTVEQYLYLIYYLEMMCTASALNQNQESSHELIPTREM